MSARTCSFPQDVQNATKQASIIFASVNTPMKIKGVCTEVQQTCASSKRGTHRRRVCRLSKVIIEKSTVPMKTAEALERVGKANPGRRSCGQGACRHLRQFAAAGADSECKSLAALRCTPSEKVSTRQEAACIYACSMHDKAAPIHAYPFMPRTWIETLSVRKGGRGP